MLEIRAPARVGTALLLTLGLSLACGSERSPGGAPAPTNPDAGTAPPALGAETLGDSCVGACGSADERKCSTASEACTLCLIDPGHVQIAYCSQDCTRTACPQGWTCEDIKAFGQPQVERACVADTATCGDGVTQLGEVCDGDDPAFGQCMDCQTWVPQCGDGVVQPGEVCEEDDPMLGECVMCQSYRAKCGDGVIQAPEVCDGPSGGDYCLECQSLESPRMQLTIRQMVANGVERIEGNSTWYYGLGAEAGMQTLALPESGDARGCGGVQVIDSNEALTRVAWVVCSEWGRSTWQFALPRMMQSHRSFDGPIPSEFGATVRVEAHDGSYDLQWTMDHMESFEVRTFTTEAPAWSQGNLQFWLRTDDPLASWNEAEARIDLNFRILHPLR